MADVDPRFDIGLYSLPEAGRLARLPVTTLRNWVGGYRYPAHGRIVEAPPVLHPLGDGEPSLSFVNLAEAVALAGFRQAGVSMQRVRKGLDYVSRAMETEHPLASQRILTDGVDLFWEYQESQPDELHLVNVTRQGQKVFPETVMRYLHEMEWAPDLFVTRWWPGSHGANRGLVVVDPRRAFGAPVIAGTGIRTEDVFQRFRGGESITDLTDDYGLTLEQVQAALRIETRLLEPLAA
jgi:uncharacterized protein (DUF433 family)